MDRINFFKNYANAQYLPELAGEVGMAHESMLKAVKLIRGALGRTNHPFWENPFTSKAQKAIKGNVENQCDWQLPAPGHAHNPKPRRGCYNIGGGESRVNRKDSIEIHSLVARVAHDAFIAERLATFKR